MSRVNKALRRIIFACILIALNNCVTVVIVIYITTILRIEYLIENAKANCNVERHFVSDLL